MADLTYKAKVETRYKLGGAWWTMPDIDKIVNFENMDTGGFLHGVILSRVDGNEWRVIEEGSSRYLKPVEVEVEPEFIEVIYKLPTDMGGSVFDPCEFLQMMIAEMNYEGTYQISTPQRMGVIESKLCAFRIEKGYMPLQTLLTNAGKAIEKLGAEVVAVRSPVATIIYSNEITKLDTVYPPSN